MLEIPGDRGGKAVLETELRCPTELCSYLRRIHRVPSIVSQSIGDQSDQCLGLAEQSKQPAYDIEVLAFRLAADVINIAEPTVTKDLPERDGVVRHEKPITYVQSVPVHR